MAISGKQRIITGIGLIGGGVAALFVIHGVGASGSSGRATPSNDTAAAAALPTASANPAAQTRGITGLNTIVTDPTIHEYIKVEQFIPNVHLDPKILGDMADPTRHYAAAYVLMVPNKQFGFMQDSIEMTGGSTSDPTLTLPDDTLTDDPETKAFQAAGYPLLRHDTTKVEGQPSAGWIAWQVDNAAKGPIRLVLHRDAATVTTLTFGGDSTPPDQKLPAADFPIIVATAMK